MLVLGTKSYQQDHKAYINAVLYIKDLVMANLELFIQGMRSLLKTFSNFGSRSFAPRDFASTFYPRRLESPFPCDADAVAVDNLWTRWNIAVSSVDPSIR